MSVSDMRESVAAARVPDVAALHPGYGATVRRRYYRVQVCLQTSCCVVQFKLHGAVPAVLGRLPGVPDEAVGPTQAFWQIIADVSQLMMQAVLVDVCGSSCGGGTVVGWTVCASSIRSAAHAAEPPPSASRMHNRYRMDRSLVYGDLRLLH